MKRFLTILSFIPVILLSLAFATHGIMALSFSSELKELVAILQLNETVTTILLVLVGVVDCSVAALLLFQQKLLPNLSIKYLFLYAGLWPIIPRILEWYGGKGFSWLEIFIYASASGLSYYFQIKRTKSILKQSIE